MAFDDRIEPIGRTGKWALTAWNLETRSLVNLLEEALKTAGKPMTIDQLSSIALKNRQGSTNSISILLKNSPERFKQVAFKTYALTSWSGIVSDFQIAVDDVGQFVEDFFRDSSVDSVPFAVLTTAFAKKSRLPTRSARSILAHHPAVIVERTDRRERMATYNASWQNQSSNTAKSRRRKPTHSEQIINYAKSRLQDTDSGEMPLIKMVQMIEENLQVRRPIIYAAIEQSKEIQKLSISGTRLKVCTLVGRS